MKRKLALAALALVALMAAGAAAIAVRVAPHWDEPCVATSEFHPPGTFACSVKAWIGLFYERTIEAGSYRELAIGMSRAEAIGAVRKIGARSVSAEPRKTASIEDALCLDVDGVIAVDFSGDRVSDFSGSAFGLNPAIPGLRLGQPRAEALALIADYRTAHPNARVRPSFTWVKLDANAEHDLERSDTWEFSLREPQAISRVTIELSEGRVARIRVLESAVELP